MKRIVTIAFLATCCLAAPCCAQQKPVAGGVPGITKKPTVEPLVPPAVANDEAGLLAAARAARVVTLEGGYRQVDLVVARVATWEQPRDLTVRLFLPPIRNRANTSENKPWPLVAYIHGGGFIGGGPAMNLQSTGNGFHRPVRALLDEGFAVASLGYRLAREAGWPAPISDALCGLRFLEQHGGHWGVDASRVGVCGHSAGARIAALVAMVPQDAFHTQDLPWKGEPASFAAVWLWAGSAWTAPTIHEWTEFGKPRDYSVMRLHFGEHPAWDNMARHRLRLRNVLPHISNAMPPIHLLRGKSDYGGDHSDARRAVAIWEALGIEAELSIVPGGHNSTGPAEATVAFFDRHLREAPFQAPPRDPAGTAVILLDQGEPAAALEVLSASRTVNAGRTPPPGDWMILHDGTLLWLPEVAGWPEEARAPAHRACRMLAEDEGRAAAELLQRRQWFRSLEVAGNVQRLAGGDDASEALTATVRGKARHEAEVFNALARANALLHDGQADGARALLAGVDDRRAAAAAARVQANAPPEAPAWARATGIDVYGRWADVRIADGAKLRMRWVEPGAWDLPVHLRYRNSVEHPWKQRVTVEHGFWLAETPTTHAQWQALDAKNEPMPEASHADTPQTGIDYLQIVEWLGRLSATHEGLVARLPTEEEWLHAATCGGREDTQGATDLHAVHALCVDPKDPGPLGVHTVLPGLGGFYGLLGGVHEWTASPGRHTARFNDASGRLRILAYPIARGGAWSSMPHGLGFASRAEHRHGNRQGDLGFRLAIGGGPDAAQWLSNVERK